MPDIKQDCVQIRKIRACVLLGVTGNITNEYCSGERLALYGGNQHITFKTSHLDET